MATAIQRWKALGVALKEDVSDETMLDIATVLSAGTGAETPTEKSIVALKRVRNHLVGSYLAQKRSDAQEAVEDTLDLGSDG